MKLTKIKITKNVHNLKKGLEIKVSKPLLLLVGDNGCGKSTLLDGVRTHLGIKANNLMKKDVEGVEIVQEGIFKTYYYDFHSGDNKFNGIFGDDIGSQITSMHTSSGLGSLTQMKSSGALEATDSLILFDEPCRGMSPKMQWRLAFKILRLTQAGNQIIMATHSDTFMRVAEEGEFGEIYDVENLEFIKNLDKYREYCVSSSLGF